MSGEVSRARQKKAGSAAKKGHSNVQAAHGKYAAKKKSKERQKMNIRALPTDLNEAIKLAENSELLHGTLGDHVFKKLLENKRQEWSRYRSQVTNYELDTYLALL